MRKSERYKKRQKDRDQKAVTDKTMWFSDLSSLDPSLKNEVWAAQSIFFMKRSNNSVPFLDPKKAARYRATDSLEVNADEYKQMFDPRGPDGSGGKAEYVSADWKGAPIYVHLKNIVKAEIEKSGKQLEVNLTDKYAKTRQMNDSYKIIYRKAFRNLINHLAKEIGIPGITESQDPYRWAENMFSKNGDNQSSDSVNKYLDLIKNQISDDQDLALYNELIYKGDYEIAFELGINYYIMNLNKWHERWADEFSNDNMHFNKMCGEFYTDLITGRPIIQRFAPEELYTSRFKRKDGEDIMHYYTEYTVTFGDFMRTMGRNLKPEKLRQVFELMKTQGAHSVSWQDSFMNFDKADYNRDNATIRIGRAAMLSTDMEVYMDNTVTGAFERKPLSWEPADYTEKRIEKRYNVWRWWYYIPRTAAPGQNISWQEESEFIFELQKFQDQQRYGDDGRYSKCPLVIYDNSSQASFTDIVMAFMPKITHLWHRYQNYLVNDVDATALSEDFIGSLLGAVDEDNNINAGDPNSPTGGNGADAYMQQWKMIKQGGTGFLKMTDNKGNTLVDPNKLVVKIQNGFLDKAEKCLAQMVMQYDLMLKSLAQSPMTSGEEVKPRTPVAALEQSLMATSRSKFFMQKGYDTFLTTLAERIVRYIITIFREKDDYSFPHRYDEFMDNVGYANGLALEGMKDVEPEEVGLTVNYVDTQSKRDFIMQLALEHIKNKELSDEFLYLLMGIDNWKYAFVLMRMAIKKGHQRIMEEAQMQHQNIMQQKQKDVELAMLLDKAKAANKDQNIMTEGKVKDMINRSLNDAKHQSQSALKKETDALRRGENEQQSNLKKSEQQNEKNLELQQPVI